MADHFSHSADAHEPAASRGLTKRGLGRRAAAAVAALGLLGLAACGDDAVNSGATGAAGNNPAMAYENPLGDITLGDPDAPVVLVEYASYTCGHCAAFHNQNLAPLKENYIDTGKVFYVFREYPLDPVATAASMLTRCVAPEKHLEFSDVLFKRQPQWAFVQDPRGALEGIARQGGISKAQFEACLTDEEVLAGLRDMQQYAAETLEVQATPTLFINDEKVGGNLPWPALEEIITNQLPG
jgi:protein-disulfide isomerase